MRNGQPKHYEAIIGLAECYYQLNRPEEAKAHLAEGHRLFPSDLAPDLVTHLVNYGDPTQAVEDRERMVKENPNDPAYRLALANTYFQSCAAGQPAVGSRCDGVGLPEQGLRRVAGGPVRFPDDGRFYARQAELLRVRQPGRRRRRCCRTTPDGSRSTTSPARTCCWPTFISGSAGRDSRNRPWAMAPAKVTCARR